MTEVNYQLLSAQERQNMAEQEVRNAETDHFRAVLGSVDPAQDENVKRADARVLRVQKILADTKAEAEAESARTSTAKGAKA